MQSIRHQVFVYLKNIMRDRILYGVMGFAFFMILLVPVFSNFSMRQVQELSITLSLSAVSSILLIVSLLLGTSSIWRDIERRYTASILTLPISRTSYVFAKFIAISLFLIISAVLLAGASAGVIIFSSSTYPSEIPIHWQNIMLAIAGDTLKYILLTAFALLFSSLSTSFFLPFFGTLAIYFCGNSSQAVYEYVTGPFGKKLFSPILSLIKVVYYILPNFSAYNFKLQAIYGLAVSINTLLYSLIYFTIYTSIILYGAIWIFSRRELP
jgi:Cu-processing system permease protein